MRAGRQITDPLAGKGGKDSTSTTDSNTVSSLDGNGLQGGKEVSAKPYEGGNNLSKEERESIQSKLAEIQTGGKDARRFGMT
jgi:hypothetical protein